MESGITHSRRTAKGGELRWGFSTGAAATAAAIAALRVLLSGRACEVVAVRLPQGIYLPVPVRDCRVEDGCGLATVIKDGGDDPDVTHGAEIRVRLRCGRRAARGPASAGGAEKAGPAVGLADPRAERGPGLYVIAGEGVGVATKAGLPVIPGEPAVNPVPREMLARNLADELRRAVGWGNGGAASGAVIDRPLRPHVLLPLPEIDGIGSGVLLEMEIEVPRGRDIAQHTLNPRLGVLGGISILGTSGLVKPFSHESYEETIRVSLSVAASNGCDRVVLSTGGKSERLAQGIVSGLPPEAFVQVADFFEFSVKEARRLGFTGIVHSAFFGKVVKMAQGHAYTHAHRVPMDLGAVADHARSRAHGPEFCRELASANTARQALDVLLQCGALDVVTDVARDAVEQSRRLSGGSLDVRLLLFTYDGTLLADLDVPCDKV